MLFAAGGGECVEFHGEEVCDFFEVGVRVVGEYFADVFTDTVDAEEVAVVEWDFGEAVGEDGECAVFGEHAGVDIDIEGLDAEWVMECFFDIFFFAGGVDDDGDGVACVDHVELAVSGVECDEEHGGEGSGVEVVAEVVVECFDHFDECDMGALAGVYDGVECGGDHCGAESFAGDIGDGDEGTFIFDGEDVDVVAADAS